MQDPYAQQLNETVIRIFDNVLRVEAEMLSQSGQDVSISELHILESVWLAPEGARSISDIAAARRVSLPSMTVAVKKLVQKGLAEKTRSKEDGRVVQVTLTRKGRKINAMHRYFHEQMMRSFLKGVAEGDKSVLLRALENMDGFLIAQLARQAKKGE